MNSAKIMEQAVVQGLIFNDRFKAADSSSLEIIERNANDPMGYVLLAMGLLAESSDREEDLYSDSLPKLLRKADSLARGVLDTGSTGTRAWMHLIRGHTRALRSVLEARFSSLVSAIKQGYGARSEYLEALAVDSSLYDAYAGLGGFHYWKSAKAGFLRWIGLIKNEREVGIRELHLAADSSQISRESARASLIWIWINEEEYDSAIAIAAKMHAQYPEGLSFVWALSRAYQFKHEYDSSLTYCLPIRDRVAQNAGNFYNLIECDAAITRCYEQAGNRLKARIAAQRLEEYYDAIPDNTRRRQKSNIGYLKRIASKP